MKMKSACRIVFALAAAFCLVSCGESELDGKWDAMVWKLGQGEATANDVYEVAHDGDTCQFICANYKEPWLENAVSDGTYYHPNREEDDYRHISSDWFEAKISGNVLTVTFKENATGSERPLKVTTTAGDIFHTFHFKQKAD